MCRGSGRGGRGIRIVWLCRGWRSKDSEMELGWFVSISGAFWEGFGKWRRMKGGGIVACDAGCLGR